MTHTEKNQETSGVFSPDPLPSPLVSPLPQIVGFSLTKSHKLHSFHYYILDFEASSLKPSFGNYISKALLHVIFRNYSKSEQQLFEEHVHFWNSSPVTETNS